MAREYGACHHAPALGDKVGERAEETRASETLRRQSEGQELELSYDVESTFPVLTSSHRQGVSHVLGRCEAGEGREGLRASLIDLTWTFSDLYTKHKAARLHFLSGLGDNHLLFPSRVSQLFFPQEHSLGPF